MKYPQLKIAHIIIIVFVAALVLGAMRSGSPAWAGAVSSTMFFVMICSLLGAALERGMPRVYWSGFATLGWGYLFLYFAPWFDARGGPYLLGPQLFAYLDELLASEASGGSALQSVPVGLAGVAATGGGFGGGAPTVVRHIEEFIRIGVSLEALLWAFAGGWVACYFAVRRERGREAQHAAPADAPAATSHESSVRDPSGRPADSSA